MSMILEGLEGVKCQMDDVLVLAKTARNTMPPSSCPEENSGSGSNSQS